MSRPKLLLADDSVTIQKVVSLTFADKGMDVIAFSDGDAAIEHIDEIAPDIVLADVHMPGINGYQVCELIRSNEATAATPVVLLVGSFEPFDRDEADRVGANSYLTKPFTSIGELVSTVERLLSEAAAVREPELRESAADTSDIDSLFEKSFAETMELPSEESVDFDVDTYDDEMIQTSYARPDPGPVVGELLYSDDTAGVDDAVVHEEAAAEALIAESFPDPAAPPIDAPASGSGDGEVSPSDPFHSVAAEPEPGPGDERSAEAETGFELDGDLLELPRGPQPAMSTPAEPNGHEIARLAPELIDLIVDKVIERLSEKERSGEARSVFGS
ncbi:MAG: response regulator [Pyrinomonadaceae bacterium]